MINFIHSVNLSSLVDKLNERLCSNKFVFKRNLILVRNYAVKRFIETQLVRTNGILSNIDVLLPQDGVLEIIGELKSLDSNSIGMDKDRLKWTIFIELLRYPEFLKDFNEVDEQTQFEIYQYAKELADVFWDYLAYIPDEVMSWVIDEPDLFNTITSQKQLIKSMLSGRDLSETVPLEYLKSNKNSIDSLNEIFHSIIIFDIPFLIPLHTRFFEFLSQFIQIEYYLATPSEYSIELYKANYLSGGKHFSMNENYNSFLNRNSEYFYKFLNSLNLHEYSIDKILIEDLENDSCLHILQNSIIKNNISSIEELTSYDNSIQIHCSHTKTREMEILKQNVLTCLHEIPDLKISDILVLLPDIESYVSSINGVLSSDKDYGIPYEISGYRISKKNDVFECFQRILNIKQSRFRVSYVLSILEIEIVSENFGISKNDFEFISKVLRETAVRWGIDSEQRRDYDIAEFDGFSWIDGFDRMFMGYATYSEDNLKSIENIVPYGNIPLSNIKAVGNLKKFVEMLREVSDKVDHAHTPEEWYEFLTNIISNFFAVPKEFCFSKLQIELLQKSISNFKHSALEMGINNKIELSIVLDEFKDFLAQRTQNFNFQSGKLTFSNFSNMCNLPYRVIFIAGLNHSEFPQKDIWSSFSELANYDVFKKSKRNEDKYFFMRTILSAQERLYFSYIGKDIHDNHELPPATSLHEIEEFLLQMYPKKDFLFEHYIHGFNEHYFKENSHLVNNSLYDYNLLTNKLAKKDDYFLFDSPMNREFDLEEISLDDFLLFYKDPVKYFVKNICGINLDIYINEIEDDEPINLNYLEYYQLRKEMIENILDDLDSLKRYLISSGFIQTGTLGNITFKNQYSEIESIKETFSEMISGESEKNKHIEIELDNVRISGVMRGIYGNKICEMVVSSINDKYAFILWIKILLLSCNGLHYTGEMVFKESKKINLQIPDEFSIEDYLRKLMYYYKIGHQKSLCIFTDYISDYWSKRNPDFSQDKVSHIWSKVINGDFLGNKNKYYIHSFSGLDNNPEKFMLFQKSMSNIADDVILPYFQGKLK